MNPAQLSFLGILAMATSPAGAAAGWFFGARGCCEPRVSACNPSPCQWRPVTPCGPAVLVMPEPVPSLMAGPIPDSSAPSMAGSPDLTSLRIEPTAYEWNPSTTGATRPRRVRDGFGFVGPEVATVFPIFEQVARGGAVGVPGWSAGSGLFAAEIADGPVTAPGSRRASSAWIASAIDGRPTPVGPPASPMTPTGTPGSPDSPSPVSLVTPAAVPEPRSLISAVVGLMIAAMARLRTRAAIR